MRVIGRASQEEEEERRTWVKSRRVERVELMTKIVECRSVGNPEEDVDAGEMGKSENSGTWETFCLDFAALPRRPSVALGMCLLEPKAEIQRAMGSGLRLLCMDKHTILISHG